MRQAPTAEGATAGAPRGSREPCSAGRLRRSRASPGGAALRKRDSRARDAREGSAGRRSADRRHPAEEPAADRSGDRGEPRRARTRAGERAGTTEPVRSVPHEDRVPAGHDRTRQRNAEGQPGRGGTNRRRPQKIMKAPAMRVTRSLVLSSFCTLLLATAAAAQGAVPPAVQAVRSASTSPGGAWLERFQESRSGPESSERVEPDLQGRADRFAGSLEHLRRHRDHRRRW